MVRSHTIEIAAGPLRYLEAGAGWPVVLIHAFPLTAEMWRPQLEAVPQGWRFIAPDMRGFGESAPSLRGTNQTMDDYAADVAALLDALAIERAVIGGLSMGGYITLALFRRAPERFTGLVLADTKGTADTPEGRTARREMSALVKARGVPAVADQMIPKLLSPSSRENTDLVAHVRRLIEGNPAEGDDSAIHAMLGRPDSTPDLARVSVPTLVIVGQEDVPTPVAESERLRHEITRSQLIVLPGVGHLSNLEAPNDFNTALNTFLTSSSAAM